MKNKYWAILLAAVILLCAGFSIPLLLPGEDAALAEIYSDSQLIKTVSLSIPQEFSVPSPTGGYNLITVRDGRIAVTEASCPDHYCMERGFVSGGTPVVCLPNRLVIEFSGEQEIDGLLG